MDRSHGVKRLGEFASVLAICNRHIVSNSNRNPFINSFHTAVRTLPSFNPKSHIGCLESRLASYGSGSPVLRRRRHRGILRLANRAGPQHQCLGNLSIKLRCRQGQRLQSHISAVWGVQMDAYEDVQLA